MDFTIKIYRLLLESLLGAEYKFITFHEYLTSSLPDKLVVLRHDVDLLPLNSLHTARIEHDLGIKGVYYFRSVPESWDESVIKEVAELGHEVGYHYENLTICKGDLQNAYHDFQTNLQKLRKLVPVKTICMHGSSFSKYDNRMLWQRYNLADFGVIGEPYLSIDFDEFFYLTDTGYAWDGGKFATRDIVVNNHGLSFHKTSEIVACIEEGNFPDKSLILAHTLWSDSLWQWTFLHLREFFRNNIKYLSRNNKLISKLYNFAVKKYWGVK